MMRLANIVRLLPALMLLGIAWDAEAQSFRVQCPTTTITHPNATANNSEPAYSGATLLAPGADGYLVPSANVNGAIKCQQIAGGDGYSTMGDGTQTYMFSFGPLSGLADIANGQPGTEFPGIFNTVKDTPPAIGDPATTGLPAFTYNGAIGLANNTAMIESVYDASVGVFADQSTNTIVPTTATIVLNTETPFKVGDLVLIAGVGSGFDGQWTVSAVGVPNPFFNNIQGNPGCCVANGAGYAFQIKNSTGSGEVANPLQGTASSLAGIDGHVDARQIMDVGVMNGNIPAPLMAIDEDDEFFLTLTNVGMIMRPDLFEQHTIHFHGYPNASAFYDGVPDASVAINIGGSFTYYYLAPDAGTYFWHCHISPPEHLQMGMVGQLYVRPRQNRVPAGNSLYAALQAQQQDLRTACNSAADILCSNPLPAGGSAGTGPVQGADKLGSSQKYVYNDGDGSTAYDVEYPLQMHGFDPSFHFVGMTFNPEGFADMKDKYFMLNGRSYPDTVTAGAMKTPSSDGVNHFSQPLNSIISIPHGGKALLRISQLSVAEYMTLASLGVPMHVVGYNAKLLRDQAGNNTDYYTNSITLGGGESLDVILDTSGSAYSNCSSAAPCVFYLYSSNLDYLSNDAENFGGLMTEVRVN